MIYCGSHKKDGFRALLLFILMVCAADSLFAMPHEGSATSSGNASGAAVMPHGSGPHGDMATPPQTINSSAVDFKTFDRDQAYRYSQRVIGSEVANYQFVDSEGKRVSLADFAGQPLIISLIYTSCYHICPTTTQYLGSVVNHARDAMPGKKFTVLTIGFDTRVDTPVAMRNFRREQGLANEKNWHFLSTDETTITALAKDLGFIYYASPRGFDHLVQASVLKSDQTLYRQVYGMKFEKPLLIEPLKDLLFNRPLNNSVSVTQSWADKIRFFCTVYDPTSDRYRFDYSLFIGIFIGIMSCLVLGVQLTKEWRRTVTKS